MVSVLDRGQCFVGVGFGRSEVELKGGCGRDYYFDGRSFDAAPIVGF